MREGWEYKKLGEVCKVIMGQSPDGNSVNSSNGIEFHQGKVFFGEKYLNVSNSFTEQPSKIAEPNSVLLCVRAPVGIVNISQRRICIGRGLCSIQPNDIMTMPFLFYALTQKQAYFDKNSTGSTFKAISSKVVINTEIPIPPLSEQQRIVEELDLLDSVIEKKKEQLKELDNLAQSIFYDMFGDPVTNEKGWDVLSFKDIATFKNGLNYHPTDNGNIIKCIGVGDFQNRKELKDFDSIKDFSIEEIIDESYYLQDGDILLVRSNGSRELVGRNMIVYPRNQKITYSGFCIRCRIVTSGLLPIILNRILSSRSTMIILRQEGRGCNISNINQKKLSSLPIIIPPFELQQQFASKIEAIEQQKEQIKQSIKEVETLFNSRMDYYFT